MSDSKIIPDFILVTWGSVSIPRLEIIIYTDRDHVEEEAEKIVAQLSMAGYFVFSLFDVREEHVMIQKYQVNQPAPVVTRRI